jgi:fumarylacetoacetate (FAA) hydrolase
VLADEAWGIDFEAEVAVITDDVPMGVARAGGRHIRSSCWSTTSAAQPDPGELAKGFGFFQSKPSSAFSPVAVTPDSLGPPGTAASCTAAPAVAPQRQALRPPDAGVDMTFDFPALIAHAARTRPLCAGTIIGSGTVSNRDGDGSGPAGRSPRAAPATAASPSCA